MVVINNPEVAQYYDELATIVNDRNLPRDRRIAAANKQELIELLVRLYEYDEDIDFREDFAWIEVGDPVLPEDIEQLIADNPSRFCREFTVIPGGKQ